AGAGFHQLAEAGLGDGRFLGQPSTSGLEQGITAVLSLGVSLSASTAVGSAPQLTTLLSPARPTFLDSIASGYLGVLIENTPAVGDWLRFDFFKTNGTHIIVSVTNTTAGTTI